MRVAVGRHHHALAAADGRGQRLVPERHHARHGVFQALGQRHLCRLQAGVAPVAALAAWVAGFQRGRRRVVAAAPDQHLLVAVLLGHVGLVQALQGAVVALVEAPVFVHRQPGAVHLVERVPQGVDGALEHAGVGDVEVVALGLEQLAGRHGLRDAGGGQVNIGPAGEAVFQVPGGFAVANQDEFVHGEAGIEAEIVGMPRTCRVPVRAIHSKISGLTQERCPREFFD